MTITQKTRAFIRAFEQIDERYSYSLYMNNLLDGSGELGSFICEDIYQDYPETIQGVIQTLDIDLSDLINELKRFSLSAKDPADPSYYNYIIQNI